MGLSMTALDIDQIVRACGVSFSDSIDPWDTLESRATLKTALLGSGVRVIISKSPCPYIETGFCPGYTSEEKDSFETH